MAYMPYNSIRGKHMTEFTVIAYEKEDGESPVEDFINALVLRCERKCTVYYPYFKKRGIR